MMPQSKQWSSYIFVIDPKVQVSFLSSILCKYSGELHYACDLVYVRSKILINAFFCNGLKYSHRRRLGWSFSFISNSLMALGFVRLGYNAHVFESMSNTVGYRLTGISGITLTIQMISRHSSVRSGIS